MHIRTATAALLATAGLLTGCSSGGGHDDPAPAATTTTTAAASPAADDGTAALTAAVKAYSAAYFKPDARAGYELLSAHCKTTISATAYAAELSAAVATYGHQAISTVHVDQVAGPLARVSYTYSVPTLNQTSQAWAREGGAWHYDAC